MITVDNISKTFGKGKDKIIAVDSVSFSVNKGEIFGLIGPDGAGKTTIFRVLTTLLLTHGGTASIDGLSCEKDMMEIRKILGYMPGKFSLYQDLTIEENLIFFASVFNSSIEENYYLIKDIYVQLEPFKHRRAGKLSGGMKQKLALCCALIHKPKVLFLDEPTTGVDPVSRKEFWEMLKKLKKQDITIVVATPYMDEAEMCDRIALLQKGKILKIASPEEISTQFPYTLYEVKAEEKMYKVLQVLQKVPQIKSSFVFGESVHVSIEKGVDLSEQKLMGLLQEYLFNNLEINKIIAGVEDAFIELSDKPN